MKKVMEPNTASKLKTTSKNSLKDILSVAGPLGISHFLVFSQTDRSLSLRLAKLAHGPTLQFRIKTFSTSHDVQAMQVKKQTANRSFTNPPLVVLNNFGGSERHLQLCTVALQNMFPPINVHKVKLKECTRVVLFHRDPETELISMRHYKVLLNPLGISKSVKRISKNKVASLHDYADMSEYVLSQAKASESDLEDDSEAQISVEEQVRTALDDESSTAGGTSGRKSRKAAIRLVEIGPRIEMELMKIMSGLMQGEVMWHFAGIDHARLEKQKKVQKRRSAFPGAEQVAQREKLEKELARKKEQDKIDAENLAKEERDERREERKQKKRVLMGTTKIRKKE